MDNYSQIIYHNTFENAVKEVIEEVLKNRGDFKCISLNLMNKVTEDTLIHLDSVNFLNLSLIGWVHFKKDTAKKISDFIMDQILKKLSSTPSEQYEFIK